MADWAKPLLRTAGLRLCVLPISAGLALLTAAITFQAAGLAAFGLVTMVAQLQLALPFADLGMGAAVTRSVARAEESPQRRRHAAALIRRTATLLAAIGTVGAFGAACAGAAGLWSSLFVLPAELAADFDLVASTVLAMFFLGLPFGLSERILIGQDRASLLVVLGLILGVANVSVAATVAGLGLPPMWLAAGLPVGSAVFLAVCTTMALKRWGSLQWGEGNSVPLRTILRGGLPVVLATAGTVLAEQHGRVVLAQLAAPHVVSEYALGLYLYMPVYSILYMGAAVLWPRFARSLDPHLWRQSNVVLLLLGLGAATGYLVFARPLSGLVSGGEMVLRWPVVLCFCLVFIAQSGHLVQENLLTDVWGFKRQAVMSIMLLLMVVPLTALGVALGAGAAAPAASLACGVLLTQVIPGRILARRVLRHGAPTIDPFATSEEREDHADVRDSETNAGAGAGSVAARGDVPQAVRPLGRLPQTPTVHRTSHRPNALRT